MSQPLEGIRVLELGNFIAGPFCGMLLGDMGADVIKIERPARGDQTRAMPPLVNGESASFAALNRNKRSLVLDLKQQSARDVVLELVPARNVILELLDAHLRYRRPPSEESRAIKAVHDADGQRTRAGGKRGQGVGLVALGVHVP